MGAEGEEGEARKSKLHINEVSCMYMCISVDGIPSSG